AATFSSGCPSFMTARPPTSVLFPYTTLFRSHRPVGRRRPQPPPTLRSGPATSSSRLSASVFSCPRTSSSVPQQMPRQTRRSPSRSEEHTSELQSRGHLVCRLLLEKKNRSQPT